MNSRSKLVVQCVKSEYLIQAVCNDLREVDELIESANIYEARIENRSFAFLEKLKKYFKIINVIIFSIMAFSTMYGQSQLKEYHRQANEFLENNQLDSCIYYYQLCDSLGQVSGDTSIVKEAIFFIGEYFNVIGEKRKAAINLTRLEGYLQSPRDSVRYYAQIGSAFLSSDITKADSLFKKGVEVSTRNKDQILESKVLFNNYASLLLQTGRYIEAVYYYERALDENSSPLLRTSSYVNLTAAFLALENWERASEFSYKGVKLCEAEEFKSRDGNVAINHAFVLSQKGQRENAILEINKSIKYFEDRNWADGLCSALIGKARILLMHNVIEPVAELIDSVSNILPNDSPKRSIEFLDVKSNYEFIKRKYKACLVTIDKISEYENEFSNPYVIQRVKLRKSLALEKLGQTKKALASYKVFQNLRDSLDLRYQTESVNILEAKYKRKTQDLEIEKLETSKIAQEEVLGSQRKTIYAVILGLLLTSILSFFLYRYLKVIQKQKITIERALGEKDILLREIHHRVKNNLQLVSSLLTLQGRSIEDEQASRAINEGVGRVRSMALIHHDLYNNDNLRGIGVRDYLIKLTNDLFKTYNINENEIKLNLNIQDLELDVDTLVPLGLIINELVTNALKYAFENQEIGLLTISISEENNLLTLVVADNGKGYDLKQVRKDSFGSTLIEALTAQLNGEMNIESDQGTRVHMSFKDYNITT